MAYAVCDWCRGAGQFDYWIPPEKRPPGTPETVLVACSACCGRGHTPKEEESHDEPPVRLPAL